jgi:asparagine synthase (glutamine-hydrolysing)
MCGIAGIIAHNDKLDLLQHIYKMNDLAFHRGPDGGGVFIRSNVAVAHRRLAIVDLTEAGHQPMIDSDKHVIAFNGEIYNYIEIREELKNLGYNFTSSTDTEVVLKAYIQWGPECIKKFNGMWALAIVDFEQKVVFCSRDRFGEKPFFYIQNEQCFAFASEIPQLLELVQPRFNIETLSKYLIYGLEEDDSLTFFRGIYKLYPGENVTVPMNYCGRIKLETYYDLSEIVKPQSNLTSFDPNLLASILEDSVKIRLRSDVQVGTCLSGGIDSSLITAFAAKAFHEASGKAFTAITAGSLDPENDEVPYAQSVAQKLGLSHYIVKPTLTEYETVVSDVIKLQAEPFGSPSILMQYFVMKKAKEVGCTVLLDGQGADELFLGYERYFVPWLLNLPLGERVIQGFKVVSNSRLTFFDLVSFLIYFQSARIRNIIRKRRATMIRGAQSFSFPSQVDLNKGSEKNPLLKLQLSEISGSQLRHLLRYEDRNSMHFAVETRLPFLDHRLVEFALNMSASEKISDGWTKVALRRILQIAVNHETAWRRKKIGFQAPEKLLFQSKSFQFEVLDLINQSVVLREAFELKKCDSSLFTKDLRLIWRLYNAAKWEKIFKLN